MYIHPYLHNHHGDGNLFNLGKTHTLGVKVLVLLLHPPESGIYQLSHPIIIHSQEHPRWYGEKHSTSSSAAESAAIARPIPHFLPMSMPDDST